MNRRGFLKFLSTATVAASLPAVGRSVIEYGPTLGPMFFQDQRFYVPVSAPAGSRFERCWFSSSASEALPESCQFFSCYFDGALVVRGNVLIDGALINRNSVRFPWTPYRKPTTFGACSLA